jgi:hypothetical protein
MIKPLEVKLVSDSGPVKNYLLNTSWIVFGVGGGIFIGELLKTGFAVVMLLVGVYL